MSYTFYTCHTGIVSCHIFCLCRSHMSHVRPGLPEGAHLSLQPPSHCRLSYVRHRTDCVWLCTHTFGKKNVWSTLGVLVTVQSDCRGWKAKPWSRCQKSSWNNLDARSLTLKNSFHCYVSFQLQRENSSFVKMDESQSYIVHICATSLRDTEDLAWTYCASRRVVMVLGVFDRLDTVVMQTGTSIKNH
jgi:hypothetical protein